MVLGPSSSHLPISPISQDRSYEHCEAAAVHKLLLKIIYHQLY